jgi:hypothetical protein
MLERSGRHAMKRNSHTLATPWLHRSSQLCSRYYKSTKSRFDHVNSMINRAIDWYTKASRLVIASLLLVVLTLLLSSYISWKFQFWDVGSNSWLDRLKGDGWKHQRGAVPVAQDQFGDQFLSVRYLAQGWTPADSAWFYATTQGSDLLPYDLFMVLEKPDTSELFRSNENMNHYRYLPQKATLRNPDALPVGFVKDNYRHKDYVGFTCAACHTGQLNYKGVGMRIDGGPAGADMVSFLQDLATAVWTVRTDARGTRERFVKRVMDRGHYASESEVVSDLQKYAQRLSLYNIINHSETPYGYSRLDVFGRTYNRVFEHIITQAELKELLSRAMYELAQMGTLTQADVDSIQPLLREGSVLSGNQTDNLFVRISQHLPLKALLKMSEKIFNRPDAPVSYPALWEHDYIQWNAPDPISGHGSLGRDACEVIGLFGDLDWAEESGISLSSPLSGQGIKDTHISFDSSIRVQNLRLIERQMKSLKSPRWPQDILPPIDQGRSTRGELLFTTYCENCHQRVDRSDPNRRIYERFSSVSDIGTDPKAANDAATYSGLAGILKNQDVPTGAGDIFIGERAQASTLLAKITLNVLATPAKGNVLSGGSDWLLDLSVQYLGEKIKLPTRTGDHDPNQSGAPYSFLNSYKARSLNGIWATAPYLHNGSVPTLYDLLLPKKTDADPKNGEYRPDEFQVGSREFDPVNVGLKSSGYKGFPFDTRRLGNSNAGHEYGARDRKLPNGAIEKALTEDQRKDLLEYLKSL